MNNWIMAIDQGTTSSRAIVFNGDTEIMAIAQQEFPQIYPAAGWVEHDPEAIWSSTLEVAKQALAIANEKRGQVVAIAITNQRETTVVWDRASSQPIYNAIVWQDRRTADLCNQLIADKLEPEIQSRTGLLLDPYFSAGKLAWILDHVDGARQKADKGQLAFGTIDSFLIWRLTGGRVHATDATNASRTSLYNIRSGTWDSELLRIFNINGSVLPEVKDCAANYGETTLLGQKIPIFGVAGDQQAATIGQCCFTTGSIKSTYGTGCFVLTNTGKRMVLSKKRLLSTIAYQLNGCSTYALEGSIFVAGASVQWLRDGLGIISSAAETEGIVEQLPDNAGVYFVPAFTGLGAPHWAPNVRGAIFGLTRATGVAEITRAALESVCYQTSDLFQALADDGVNPVNLRVDGGMVANDWLLQFLSDLLALPLIRPKVMETTALGAAYLAGSQAGIFGSPEEFSAQWQQDKRFEPKLGQNTRAALLSGWREAVYRVTTEYEHQQIVNASGQRAI